MLKRGFRVGVVALGFSGVGDGTCTSSLIRLICREARKASISLWVIGGSVGISSMSMACVSELKNSCDSSSFHTLATSSWTLEILLVVKSPIVKRNFGRQGSVGATRKVSSGEDQILRFRRVWQCSSVRS